MKEGNPARSIELLVSRHNLGSFGVFLFDVKKEISIYYEL